MTILAAVLAGAMVAPVQETKEFRHKELGLIFQHPVEWQVEKKKYQTDFYFEVGEGEPAKVSVHAMDFREDASKWQEFQAQVVTDMKRTVDQQWEETILGVPLLLTRSSFEINGGQQTHVNGLLYSATKAKLNFRIESSSQASSQAEEEWRKVLLSLRTVSGKMPQPENPTVPLPEDDLSVEPPSRTTLSSEKEEAKIERGELRHEVAGLGRTIVVLTNPGWKVEKTGDSDFLKHEDLKGSLKLSFVAGSPTQATARLRQASSSTLDRFSVVSLRKDEKPKSAASGAVVTSSIRKGQDADEQDLVVWHIIGAGEVVMYSLTYESSDFDALKADQKLINALIKTMFVEVKA